ncbi:ClC family H(+)/Cl(-) exchange transporter [Vagococcus intermedius]|uniref:ClC family H(+)/Cl(-) exchange transporter n=1 Tax=Vagococcus intermedius TaxID=2991418 RepID=A0AAF0CVJ9_9ENTE|nr:ClC family H(+)/Cl(-) exchange transporter [Vagococcus intermedius]WEG73654.1 ClC family H(+)/Cl(-) exchange transporter [Vagococcus intermedius]WEG75738.1 ClC family H(+)/Cl(-) exchange transporter [Vagococcus intermedius]
MTSHTKKKFVTTYFDRTKLIFIAKGILVGITAGLVVSLFRVAIEKMFHLTKTIYYFLHSSPIWLLPWLGISILLAIILGQFIKSDPFIKGSGIPQVEGQIAGTLDGDWFSVLWKKGLAGILAISSGLFLGREGPSIQLGAAAGQGINQLLKGNTMSKKVLLASGAGAGLSAAFNAPFAGLLFVLEEIQHNFSPVVLLTTLSATTTANFISLHFFGLTPILSFGSITRLPLKYYWLLIVFGIFLGIAGVIYQKTLLGMPRFYQLFKKIPNYYYGIIPLVLVIPIGFAWPNLLGGGSEVIFILADNKLPLLTLSGILLLRFAFSMISYGSGLPGGIFLPILSLGAILGTWFASASFSYLNINDSFTRNFLILGMAGLFTAISKAPLTACILITEMVGDFQQLMTIAVVSLVAYIVADLLGASPIYEALLEKMTGEPEENIAGNKEIIEISLHTGCDLDGKMLKETDFPVDCLVASITRGEKEFIPKGDTLLLAGDRLNILTHEKNVAHIKSQLQKQTNHYF